MKRDGPSMYCLMRYMWDESSIMRKRVSMFLCFTSFKVAISEVRWCLLYDKFIRADFGITFIATFSFVIRH